MRPTAITLPFRGSRGTPADPRWRQLSGLGAAIRLADEIGERQRQEPIVCVSNPKWSQTPIVDMDDLARVIAGRAALVVLEHGEAQEELGKRLPKNLQARSGGLRIWFPFALRGAKPSQHPQTVLRERDDGAAIEWVREQLDRYYVEQAPVPQKGETVSATVRRVDRHEVECELATGRTAAADRLHLTSLREIEPARIYRPGQSVLVTVADPKARPVRISLLEHEPDPWTRVLDEWEAARESERDLIIVGRVTGLRNFGAFVEVLPGASGLVPKGKISDAWVGHPEERLRPGELVAVRVLSVDVDARRIELTMRSLEQNAPAQALSLLPGGPPWLEDASTIAVEEPEPLERSHAQPPPPPPPPSTPAPHALPDAGPPVQESVSGLPEDPVRMPGDEIVPVQAETPAELPAPSTRTVDDTDDESLEALLQRHLSVADGQLRALRKQQEQLEALLARLPARGSDLQREQAALEQKLERLGREREAAERWIAKYADDRGVPSAMRSMRRSVEGLRRQLEVAERARQAAVDEALSEHERALGDSQGRAQAEQRSALLQRLTNASEADLFVAACAEAWERDTEPADRLRFPWRAPLVGEKLLSSLARVRLSQASAATLCAHVACGRIYELPGADVHNLRAGKGATAAHLRRDGATAWRCKATQGDGAVRLHYWQRSDGSVELAKFGYHDDYSI